MSEEKHICTVTAFHGDGEHDFLIPYAQLLELEEKLSQGPMRTLMNFDSGDWSPLSVFEIIRLGLIGGGTDPAQAYKHAQRYVVQRPIGESVPLAITVMSRAIMGPPKAEEPAIG